MTKSGIDITLANGKEFSPENIDLEVLLNMRNIPRGYMYTGISMHDNYNLMDHSIASVIVGAKYWDWLEHKGENEILHAFPKSLIDKWGNVSNELAKEKFVRFCLMHDWDEVVTGDLVPSFKTKEYRQKEDIAYKAILDYLGFEPELKDPDRQKIMKKHLKIVDIITSMWEIRQLVDKGHRQVQRVYDVRKKLLDNYTNWQEIEPFVKEIGAYLSSAPQ